jgi:uncharacterized protein
VPPPPPAAHAVEAAPSTRPIPAPPATAPRPAGQAGLRYPGVLPLTLVAACSLAPVLGPDPAASPAARLLLGLLAGLTLLAALLRHYPTARLGLALTATLAAFALPWQAAWWPLPGLAGIGTYLVAGAVPALRAHPSANPELAARWTPGRLGRAEAAAITAIAVLTGTTLLAYHALTPPALGFGAALLRALPPWAPILAGLAFIAGNACIEEVLFRGIVLTHLQHTLGRWPAVMAQAVGFGLLHLHGYPHGPIGAALATGYGLLLGLLRLHTGGLLACWITHMTADAVIFTFILQAAAHTH